MANHSYRQILRSSALVGGSSVVKVLLGAIRTKVLALLIGTEGMGLFGAYESVTTFVSGIAGMGINTSGVRQIAEATGTDDQPTIARTVHTLRRTSLILGILGMLAMALLAPLISEVTFGNSHYAPALALLSVTVLCSAVTGGQTALIQGLRRIRALAALTIWGALLGTAFSIPIIFWFGVRGIVPFLVTLSALSLAITWWYARRISVPTVRLPVAAVWAEARALLGLGVVFMASGLMVSAVSYLTRVMIIRQMGLEAAGLYQSAFTLASVYVGFVLGAMGADYYPRLTAVSGDNLEVNRLVNEQTEAGLLMAVPGILGTLTFAPWVIHALYSAQFEPAVEILRWQILGILGRVMTWPLGFVLMAKGRGRLFFGTELASNLVHLGLIWFGMRQFGLSGLGLAFFGLYVFYGVLVLVVVRRVSGFHWTPGNVRLGLGALLVTVVVFVITGGRLPVQWGIVIGSLIAVVFGIYSVRELTKRAGYANLAELRIAIARRIHGRQA